MSETGFYSRRRQVLREFHTLFRIFGLDVFLGGFYILPGFYLFHTVGESQVYNVISPFVIASLVAGYLSWIINVPQSRGKTFPYYFGLPRERVTAWDAQVMFVVLAIVWMEAVIVVAAMFKVGGAGMTPFYRMQPEPFAFPFVIAIVMFACVQRVRFDLWVASINILLVVLFCFWLYSDLWNNGQGTHRYSQPDAPAFVHQYLFAVILMTIFFFILARIRDGWRDREVGEIQ